MSEAHDVSGPRGDGIEVIRSEERLVAGTQRVVTGRVRLAKRIVVEERTVTVSVRREELVVEHLPPGPSDVATGLRPSDAGAPVLELVLSEEEVEVVTRVVPRERVRVFVDTTQDSTAVEGTVRREVVDVTTEGVVPGATS